MFSFEQAEDQDAQNNNVTGRFVYVQNVISYFEGRLQAFENNVHKNILDSKLS
jgi:hypothetical protein